MRHEPTSAPRRRVLKLAAGVAAAAWAARPAHAAGEPLVVHHIGPLSGVLAKSNGESLDAARLYLDGYNARGGAAGRPVQLQALDDGQDPKRAVEHFDRLAAAGELLALLLPRTTPTMEALMPGVAQRGIPVVGPQTGASFVTEPPKREIFTLRASYQKEAERALRLQHSMGVRSFGFVLADDAFGRDTYLAVDRVMKELKLEPAALARIDNRKAEVTDAVRTLLARRPEVVLLICSSKGAAEFIKAFRGQGARATFMSLSNTSNNDYIQALGDQARGAIVMQVLPSPFSAATALAREYAAAAATKSLPLSYAGMYGFTTAKLLALALQRIPRDPTPERLIQALEGLGEVDLGGLRLRYGPGERTGSTYVEATIITHDGRFMR